MLELVARKAWPEFQLDVALRAKDERVVLFGPSGSGKSLTLQCIAGLICPDAGRITINDRPVFDSANRYCLPPQRRRVGYVPQGYGLFPHLTVGENIAYGISQKARNNVKLRVLEMLERMRLVGLGDRYPRQLSGGQQQRVALARALIVAPDILLLDEPFAALDSAIRSKLRQEILDLARQFRGTILFVTHDLAEGYMLGERIAVFDRGRVLQAGPRDDVLYRPATRTVARFTGAKNLFSGRVVDRAADHLQVAIEEGARFVVTTPPYNANEGENVEICVRPDDVMLLQPDRPASAPVRENQLRGWIVADMAQGVNYVLFFKIGSASGGFRDYDLEIHVPRHTYERLDLATQREWTVSLKKGAIHVIGKMLT